MLVQVVTCKHDLFTRKQAEATHNFHWSEGKDTPSLRGTSSFESLAVVRRAGSKAVYDCWSSFWRSTVRGAPTLPVPTPKNLVTFTRQIFPLYKWNGLDKLYKEGGLLCEY